MVVFGLKNLWVLSLVRKHVRTKKKHVLFLCFLMFTFCRVCTHGAMKLCPKNEAKKQRIWLDATWYEIKHVMNTLKTVCLPKNTPKVVKTMAKMLKTTHNTLKPMFKFHPCDDGLKMFWPVTYVLGNPVFEAKRKLYPVWFCFWFLFHVGKLFPNKTLNQTSLSFFGTVKP